MKINLKRLFLSGFVTGIIIMIVGGGLVPIIGPQMDEVLKERLLPPLSPGAMAYFALCSLAMGIALVGLFALLHRFIQSRARAIFAASFLYWLFHCFFANFSLVAYGFMPLGLTVIGTLWAFFELLIGLAIGSRLYKE